MDRNQAYIKNYQQCGQMPLYLLQLADGHLGEQCLLLCRASRFRQIMKLKKSPCSLSDYGKVLYRSSGMMSGEIIKAILKDRYDVDLDDIKVAGPGSFL